MAKYLGIEGDTSGLRLLSDLSSALAERLQDSRVVSQLAPLVLSLCKVPLVMANRDLQAASIKNIV